MLNTRERFVRTLTGQDVDRVPFMKVFGGTNAVNAHWEQEHPGISNCIDKLLQFEGEYRGWQIAPVNTGLSSVGQTEVLSDDGVERLERRGDGTVVRIKRDGQRSFSQVVTWPVETPDDWCQLKDRHLVADDPKRFPANWDEYANRYQHRDYPLQLTHGGVYGFVRNLMGDENLAYAFYDEPALVHDMMDTYTDMCIRIWENMTSTVDFDLIECWEDMAFNTGAMISPALFREFMQPNYVKIKQFADEHQIKIILVDSDGLIEGLTPLMLESGVNALYPFEVQAGNDVRKMLDTYPVLGAVGCLDKNVMDYGRKAIDAEMERARELIRGGRLIPGPDHFPIKSSFENYRYFMERLRDVVLTTKVEQ